MSLGKNLICVRLQVLRGELRSLGRFEDRVGEYMHERDNGGGLELTKRIIIIIITINDLLKDTGSQ